LQRFVKYAKNNVDEFLKRLLFSVRFAPNLSHEFQNIDIRWSDSRLRCFFYLWSKCNWEQDSVSPGQDGLSLIRQITSIR